MTTIASAPTATTTFLFTDIAGSTRLWAEHRDAMSAALARHDALLRDVVEEHGGTVFKTVGDAVCAAFPAPLGALAAALAGQRALAAEDWSAFGADLPPLAVRMAVHTGVAEARDGDWFGQPLNRVARLLAIGHGGQVLVSRAAEELVADHLPDGVSLRDLGEHRLKDLARPEQVFQVVAPGLEADIPPLRSLDPRRHNLPAALTSFVGREREIGMVIALLRRHRLVTLTGIGGAGKTRLATQVAADQLDAWPDGARFVDLSGTDAAAGVAPAVAQTLGVREVPGRSLAEAITDHLRDRQSLLILDNCEQVAAAVAELADHVLRRSAGLRVLATSREPLHVAGEVLFAVPALSVPDADALDLAPEALAANLSQYEAVRLFTDRATAVRPDFRITAATAAAVAHVCRRLDGIPLALELAAARVRVMSVADIAARLDDRFRLLTGGSRQALPRHQTLRAAIDWSFELLDADEKVLLRRLAVFRGGWSLREAEAVCGHPPLEGWRILDLLAMLVDRSLVVAEEEGAESRFRLLETVGAYAAERLAEAQEARATRDRHLIAYLAVAEDSHAALNGPGQQAAHRRLRLEHDNTVAALHHAVATGSAEAALRMAWALGSYWRRIGAYQAGWEATVPVLSMEDADEFPVLKSRALVITAGLALRQGDVVRARDLALASLALSESAGDAAGAARAHNFVGMVADETGDYEDARLAYEASLAIYAAQGNAWGAANTMANLANALRSSGDLTAAEHYYEQALAIQRGLGDEVAYGRTLNGLGLLAEMRGDYPRARACHAENLAIKRAARDQRGAGIALYNLGLVHLDMGDRSGAREMFDEAETIARRTSDRRLLASILNGLGLYHAVAGDLAAAAARFGESVELAVSLDDRPTMAIALGNRSLVAISTGDAVAARADLAACLTLRRAMGDPYGRIQCLAWAGWLGAALEDAGAAATLMGAADAECLRRGVQPLAVYAPWRDQAQADLHRLVPPATLTAWRAAAGNLPASQVDALLDRVVAGE